ncbi:MAG: NAD-dependent epimerase/dehydratase family protein [Anaerolineales bacterium]|jgi:dihydroflavonol-4-reductase
MKAFITGGSGFVGGRIVEKLMQRGYQVSALARSPKDIVDFQTRGVSPVPGDITNMESMRNAMRGSDVVFHLAGWYHYGDRNQSLAEKINVGGARNVLGLAFELGIPKIVHTSTVAIYGDTHGQLVNETNPIPSGPFLTEYDRTKWAAHVQVALPLIAKGAPITIVLPGVVYGPNDKSLVGELMRRFYLRQLPVFPAPDLGVTFAHVDDIAEGHLLAAEKGKPGESYILAGPAVYLRDMVKVWASILRRPEPGWMVPPAILQPFAPLMAALETYLPVPEMISSEAIRMLNATYFARSDKARDQLGWHCRQIRPGMTETFNWIAQNSPLPPSDEELRRRSAGLALGAAVGLLLVWLATRRRSSR